MATVLELLFLLSILLLVWGTLLPRNFLHVTHIQNFVPKKINRSTNILSLGTLSILLLVLTIIAEPTRVTPLAKHPTASDSALYQYPYPAQTQLQYNHTYTTNGIQYELVSVLGNYDDKDLDSNQGIAITKVITFRLTNTTDSELNETSCFDNVSASNPCSLAEGIDQDDTIDAFNFGCVAQRTGYKNYQTIADTSNVFSDGGFYGDQSITNFHISQLAYQTSTVQAMSAALALGSTTTPTVIFAPKETKTVSIEIDSQCVAVGAEDQSVFWGI